MHTSATAITSPRAFRSAGSRGALLAALLLAGTLVPGAADAARFGVQVVDAAGEPVVGASVCVGLEGNYRQFGTAFTDVRGEAPLIEVPDVPFVVTVSKTRFAGVRLAQPAHGIDLVRRITLESGVPGPRCKAGSALAANPPDVRVLGVEPVGVVGATTLLTEVSGAPSHYRIGGDRRFIDELPWQAFEPAITLPERLADADTVYLQVRRFEGRPDAWLEARSDVFDVPLRSR